MGLRQAQKNLIQKELNGLISRCLWKPGGDPGPSLIRRATAAYVLLRELGLRVDHKRDVLLILQNNDSSRNYL